MILTNLFQIDGKSLYAPDCDIEPSYSDLDSSDSGRDEAGFMHREVVREKSGYLAHRLQLPDG